MATPSTVNFPPTGDLVDTITNGSFWQLGADRTIRWSTSNGFAGEFFNNPATVTPYVESALSVFSYYANVKFVGVGHYTSPIAAFQNASDINFSLDSGILNMPSNVWAIGHFPHVSNNDYAGQPGDIFLNVNSAANFLPSYEPGSAGWALLLHEVGHALGLKHTHDNGGTGRPTLADWGFGQFDVDWVSVMSYNDLNFNLLQFNPATPLILDVIGLQYLYGVNPTTNLGNTIHPLSSAGIYYTVWDAGGVDQVDASGATTGWFIQLPILQLSTLVPEKFGLAIPIPDLSSPRTLVWLEGDIENAVGSAHDDQIYGNALANAFAGGFGNDYLDGDEGFDTAFFSGARSQYTITRTATGHTVSGPDGVDTLVDIERAQFGDGFTDLINSASATSLSTVSTVYQGVLRHLPTAEQANSDASQLDAGLSLGVYVSSVLALAQDSTIPALVVFGFIVETTPLSSHLDGLASFAQTQFSAYAAQGVGDPHIGPYEALGLGLAGTTQFASRFSTATDSSFIATAYLDIFGRAASGAQLTHFQSQLDYFEGLYTSVGVDLATAEIRSRGAVVGQMLGFAAPEFGNDYGDAARAFLVDAADGQVAYGSSLLGTWG